jgi:hypothetical protein
MLDGSDEQCQLCGQGLDIVINPQDESQTVGECTNPNCPGNAVGWEKNNDH